MPDEDPVRDLNNYLQEGSENLTRFLHFSNVQEGPNNQAVHTVTYTFRGVKVGTGTGPAIALAKRKAAEKALQYFHAHGIPA